jgi:MFS family permease
MSRIGATKSYIGSVMGLTTATLVVLTFFLRNRIDFLDKKKWLLISAGIGIFIYLGYFIRADLATIPFLRFAQGIIYAIGFTFGMTAAVEIIPPGKRAGWIGIFGVSGALTNAAGPVLAEFIIHAFSFQGVFLAAAASSLLWFLCLLGVKVPASTPARQTISSLKAYRESLLLPVLFGSLFAGFFSFISDYAKEMNVYPISYYFLSYTAVLIGIRFLFKEKLNIWNRDTVIMGSFFTGILALTAGVFLKTVPQAPMLGLIGIFYGTTHGFLYPTLNVLFVEKTPERRGKATLMFLLFFNLGNTISSFFYGWIAEMGGYSFMYLTAIIINLIVLGFSYSGRVLTQGLMKVLKK